MNAKLAFTLMGQDTWEVSGGHLTKISCPKEAVTHVIVERKFWDDEIAEIVTISAIAYLCRNGKVKVKSESGAHYEL